MYIRETKTSTSAKGESYFTYRLVSSVRIDNKVRQITLLNLGRHFSLPRADWPTLCIRLELLLSGQLEIVSSPVSADIESLAQRYYSQLIAQNKVPVTVSNSVSNPAVNTVVPDFREVDVDSVELIQPRSVGVEHAGLYALNSLGMPDILREAGLNKKQCSCAMGNIIARMAAPGSELSSFNWLCRQSSLGELLDVDFDGISLNQFYRVSDLLVRNRDKIEELLFTRITDLFSLPATVTLYDLTNSHFEGEMTGNDMAKRGHSKQKRSDCPLITLGLVLDGSGFIRRSRVFDGNVAEGGTLEGMLLGLGAPASAVVIMDRGIATEVNVAWLVEHNYRYLVANRERNRYFDETLPVATTTTASEDIIRMQRVLSDDGSEVRLYCQSDKRADKERGILQGFMERFESGLKKLAQGLVKPRCEKRLDKLNERIGRLKEQCHGVGQHYTINFVTDETGKKVTGLTWEKNPVANTMLTHPGVYCLRTNETGWDEEKLWRTYTMLTDLESVFRSLKSELGLRPIFHHTAERTQGHLFITVLAYQAVQVIRKQLKDKKYNSSWRTLREILTVQRRVTTTFRQRNGRMLHIRKATVAEPELQKIYEKLNISETPGGVKKLSI